MRFSYRRVAFFEFFGRCKIRCYFGAVLGGSWGGFWEVLGLVKWILGLSREIKFRSRSWNPKKWFQEREGSFEGGVTHGSGGPKLVNDEWPSIVGIIDHWVLKSLIIGYWNRCTRFARKNYHAMPCLGHGGGLYILYYIILYHIYIYIYILLLLL